MSFDTSNNNIKRVIFMFTIYNNINTKETTQSPPKICNTLTIHRWLWLIYINNYYNINIYQQ